MRNRCGGGSFCFVPRKPRVEYPGAIYHVMSRGNGRQPIFRGDVDRLDFVKTLAEACEKSGIQAHAYCLTANHFHLVVETPNANLVAGMKWFLSAYTLRYNHRNRLFGHVFSGRYMSAYKENNIREFKKRAPAILGFFRDVFACR